MTEEPSLDAKIAQLSKQIQDQSRFTRVLTVACTTAILGVMFYTLIEVFSTLPSLIVANYMAQMPTIVMQWNAAQKDLERKNGNAPTAPLTKAK